MQYAWRERSNIMEFEGGVSRAIAEERARVEMWNRREEFSE